MRVYFWADDLDCHHQHLERLCMCACCHAVCCVFVNVCSMQPGFDYRREMQRVKEGMQAKVQDASLQAVFTDVVQAAAAEVGLNFA